MIRKLTTAITFHTFKEVQFSKKFKKIKKTKIIRIVPYSKSLRAETRLTVYRSLLVRKLSELVTRRAEDFLLEE